MKSKHLLFITCALAIGASAVLWTLTPARQWLNPRGLLLALSEFGRSSPMALPAIGLGIGFANALTVPINALLLGVALAFPGWPGFWCGMLGAETAALLSAWMGRRLGADLAENALGDRFRILSQELQHNGIAAVIALCWIPIAPNVATNWAAGVCRVPYWKLALGTAIGFLPGLVILNLLGREMRRMASHPTVGAALAGVGALALLGVAYAIGKRLKPGLEKRFEKFEMQKNKRDVLLPVVPLFDSRTVTDHESPVQT